MLKKIKSIQPLTKCLFQFKIFFLKFISVPDATLVYIRGWLQMVFYYHMIYSPETNNQGKTSGYVYIYYIQWNKACCFTMLHTLCMMSSWCCIGPIWLSSWFPHGCFASSTVADQLLVLFPTGWAGPPLHPLPLVTPFPSGPMHSPIYPSATIRVLEFDGHNLVHSHDIWFYGMALSKSLMHESTDALYFELSGLYSIAGR